MDNKQKINYWLKLSQKDWIVAEHLFEKKDYAYSLFFGHLTIEKILKAIFVKRNDKMPPKTHRLTYLAEKINLRLSKERLELFEAITDFNIEARYPDEKFLFYKKCTKKFTEEYLENIKELKKWLLRQV